MSAVEIRPIRPDNRAAADALTVRLWGETRVVYVSGVIETSTLPGVVALIDGGFAGAVTWAREGDALRIVTIASLVEHRGVGRALLAAVEAEARAQGAARLVVSTVNSNLRALGFCQVNGYVLVALHADAIAGLRAIKPGISRVDPNGIPIRDQLDLEKRLA